MTSMGFSILDNFTKFIDAKLSQYPHDRLFLSKTDLYILKRMYNWEHMDFPTETDLAEELNLTFERVRRRRKRGFYHLRVASKRSNTHISNIVSSVYKYSLQEERNAIYKTIVRLWLNELPEFPALPIISLLAALCNEKMTSAIHYLKSWKKARTQETFRRIIQKRRILRNEAILKDHLLLSTIWFDKVGRWKKEAFLNKQPKRKIVNNDRYISGEFNSEKCQRLVQYESNVEFEFIQALEESPIVIYYLEQPVTIPYSRKEIDYHYTPDFAILLKDGRCILAEVKGSYADMLDPRVHRRMEALIEYCETHGFGLLLTNGRYSLNYLRNYPCTPGLEKAIQDKLDERKGRIVSRRECDDILSSYGAKKIELLSLVLKNNWGLYPYPFMLLAQNDYLIFREKIISKLPSISR